MKIKNYQYLLILLFCSICSVTASSQQQVTPTSDAEKWVRVQSENGEFSIEVPSKYKFYRGKVGFSITSPTASAAYEISDVRMLNGYNDDTLISFEAMEAPKGALDAIYGQDTYNRANISQSKISKPGFSIRQVVQKTDNYYLVRQYFASRSDIYILTAACRTGETARIKRYLESLVFTPNAKQPVEPGTKILSSIQADEIGVEMGGKIQKRSGIKPPPIDPIAAAKIKDEKKLVFLNKPYPTYVESAKRNKVTGRMQVRATFSADGYISHLVVVEPLSDGLLRQVLYAAIRIKYLPGEKEGKPQSVVKTIEYSFDIF